MENELKPLTPKDYKKLNNISNDGVNQNKITLGIYGFDDDPKNITELLGLSPKETGKKGEVYYIGKNKDIKKVNDYNYWTYGLEEETSNFIGDFIEKFIDDVILKRIDKFNSLNKKCDLQLQIVQYYSIGFNPGLHIDRKRVEILSKIGASIDIDIYCLTDE